MSDISVDAGASPLPANVELLLQLAERCEREGPSEALDGEIATMLGWRQNRNIQNCWMQPGASRLFSNPPTFTSSFDAAMTLVPDDLGVQIQRNRGRRTSWNAALWLEILGECAEATDMPTPALALCSAALRARAASR